MQRLYVGGLSHSVTQKDLTDRFGKFGNVEDVELRTRRDDEGVPYKTFAYINLSISTTDLRKCMTVLNKSKWKGGTLQIEPAKESFLHKLAQERQLEQQRPRQDTDNKQQNTPKLLESLSKAGVENFTMKAAVPGTEIPGHKDWVVSKYGRVLPVMQLRRKKGTKTCTIKYDPSKYCHNIRRLDPPTAVADPSTPVAQLTWQMNGGDDDISRKRRGEFPPYRPPKPKRTHTDALESIRAANQARPAQVVSCAKLKNHQPMNEFVPANDKRPAQRREHARYEDSDSEEEMRRLVALEQSSHNAPGRDVQDDNLEVVGDDYLVKFEGARQKHRGILGSLMTQDEDDYDSADTDELFTSRKRPLPPRENISGERTAAPKRKREEQDKGTKKTAVLSKEAEEDSTGTEEMATSRKPSLPQKKNIPEERTGKVKRETKEDNEGSMEMMTVHSEEDEDEMDSADSDYEAMFANVTRLEISLADLQKLAQESLEKSPPPDAQVSPARLPKRGTLPEDILADLLGDDGSDDEREAKKEKQKGRRVARTSLPPFRGTATLDEDALKKTDVPENTKDKSDGSSSSFEEEAKAAAVSRLPRLSPKDEQEEVSLDSEELPISRKPSLPPQKNISEERTGNAKRKIKDDDEGSKEMTVPSEEDEDEVDSAESDDEATFPNVTRLEISLAYLRKMATHSLEKRAPPNVRVTSAPVPKRGLLPEDHLPTFLGDSSSEDEREAKKEKQKGSTVPRTRLPPFRGTATLDEEAPKTTGAPENKKGESDASSSSSEEEAEEAVAVPRPRLSAGEEEERQMKDNKRRLAAVEQRRKEAEEHKKLIQGALANLDAVTPRTGKHIVFNFDDDEPTAIAADESVPVRDEDRAAASGPRLFGSSEDEEDGDEEEDGGRFHIRPQFEGQAGQKLMELQSRFGTDERFRMDSRFLEEEDNEDNKEESDDDGGAEVKTSVVEDEDFLQEEKKRNMSILQGLLGHQANSAKPSAKTKIFRDVSALHYDPSREEHAAFESKADSNKKSKSAQRKKREEAQKLPEVSKEIFYDVSGDLKAMFGPAAVQKPAEQPKASWDEEEEEEEKDEEQPAPEEASGFMFSFFGDDIQTASEHKEYKAESIQSAKVFRWQQDSRLQDSSEDEEDEEEVQQEESSAAPKNTTEEMVSSSNNFFFFRLDDSRLTEGPKWFCRSSQLEEEREEWEERRTELRQEYRKKHKDACRKLKSSQKT